jgi:hypothetical protein
MNQPRILQYRQAFQELVGEHLHQLGTKSLELILLDQLIEVRREALKDEAEVIFVDEGFLHPEDMMLVVRVVLRVQLCLSALAHASREGNPTTDQVQYSHLHLALIQVRRLVLDDFDGADIVRAHILALDDLAEGALT